MTESVVLGRAPRHTLPQIAAACSLQAPAAMERVRKIGTPDPWCSVQVVRQSALKHLVDTFFEGSAGKAVAALLGKEGFKISDEELDRIARLIEEAKKDEKSE